MSSSAGCTRTACARSSSCIWPASGSWWWTTTRTPARFEAGDLAYLIGPYEELLRLLLSPAVATLG